MNKRPENDKQHEELRQQLWELAYGLLDDDAAAALTATIKSDPAIARLYSEVKLQTDLVSAAARIEDSSLSISAGEPAVSASVSGKKGTSRSGLQAAARAASTAKSTGTFGTNWLAVVGTTALLLLLGYVLWQPPTGTDSTALRDYYYTRVTGLTSMTEGITQTIGVESKDIHNNGRSAKFDVRLVDAEGHETYRTEVRTASNGRAEVELPGVVLKKGVRLEVIPAEQKTSDRSADVVAAELQVAEEKRRTVLLLEKPFVHPGEKAGFQMFSLGEYSKEIAPPATDELMVQNQSGRDVVQPMWNVDARNGVIHGEFELPSTYSRDEELAMRRRALRSAKKQGEEGDQLAKASEEALPLGGSSGINADRRQLDRNSLARGADGARSAATDKVELQQAPNSGAGIVARAADAKGQIRQKGVAAGPGSGYGGNLPGAPALAAPGSPAPSAPGSDAAPSPAEAESSNRKNMAGNIAPERPENNGAAMKAASNGQPPVTPAISPPPAPAPLVQDGQAERAFIKPGAALPLAPPSPSNKPGEPRSFGADADPVGAQPQAGLAKQSPEQAAANRFAESRAVDRLEKSLTDVEVQIPAEVRGQNLILVARHDGRVVARRELTPLHEEAVARVDLPPEVNGLVEVELLRKSKMDAPVLREQMVRASHRALQFELAGLKDSYAPGEKVQLSVRVLDEQNKPAAAAVGVRVWNEAAVRAKGGPLLLVDDLARDEADALAVASPLVATAVAPEAPALKEAAKGGPLQAKSTADTAVPAPPVNEPLPSAENALALKDAATRQLGTRDSQPEAKQAASPAVAEVFFADNQAAVEQEYARAVAMAEVERAERARAVGRVLLWAGAGLMLFIGVLLMSRRSLNALIWIPAVGVAALSLALGIVGYLPPSAEPQIVARLETSETTAGTAGEVDKSGMQPVDRPAEPMPESNADLDQATVSADAPAAAAVPPLPADEGAAPDQPFSGGPPGAPLSAAAAPKSRALTEGESLAEAKSGAPAEQLKRAEKAQAAAKPLTAEAGEANEPQAKKFDRSSDADDAAGGFLAGATLPDSLFWRPLSPVAPDGTFTIEFTMPAAESDYRLLIDAIGSGRVGGKEQILRVRAE